MKQLSLASTLWSAAPCRRFGRSQTGATAVRLKRLLEFGDRSPKAKAATRRRTPKSWLLVLLIGLLNFACAASPERRSLPPEVESTIGTINEEIAAERYEKIYNDAAELWRQDATLEQSTANFKTLKAKLGTVENRTLQSAIEQQNSGGPLKGRSYIVTYRTRFQNGEAMETFTLVEREGRWLLARYFVNSTALK